ncbi:D-2-hydroxyacid dehydrogenase [Moraxella sp. Tifton1]|uniref:D-2-hydroxyacid dehydrogenase n=1 Tax=Moraxella oculi TaxID=2940516 RepID=UPI002011F3FE|nr:D-2-hydroxyacid dehydrogenase [Moraxella sp. Tifton1]MCL1623233.1 D-2-hydroxyacid dehydrogenase [Moraxella sp. Tifton1]
MKAVFLDTNTFSAQTDLSLPASITDYIKHDNTPNDAKTIIERCQDADIVITNKVEMSADVIARLPKLKLIHVTATGINNIDTKACQTHQVAWKNVAGYSTVSVPEHTFMLILTIMRAGLFYHQKATDGTWQDDGRFCLIDEPIFDLSGKTLGIIGAGNIGRSVGRIATAFGMNVLYAEHRNKQPRDDSRTDFYEVLANSDIISLHCPLTDDTTHLINDETIAAMGKKPIIINVARGGVVDSQAIVTAINSGQILGYGSDVFESEPFDAKEPLLTLKNHPRVFFTPHNAWGSLHAQVRLWEILCTQIDEFVKAYQPEQSS